MKFGAIFALGEGHIIRNNRMTHLNTAHCNEMHDKFGCLTLAGEPGFLESGIYLAKGGERPAPARHITIENNIIQRAQYGGALHRSRAWRQAFGQHHSQQHLHE